MTSIAKTRARRFAQPMRRGLGEASGAHSGLVVGEGRAQQVAAQALKLLAVATVDGGGGVQVYAEPYRRSARKTAGFS